MCIRDRESVTQASKSGKNKGVKSNNIDRSAAKSGACKTPAKESTQTVNKHILESPLKALRNQYRKDFPKGDENDRMKFTSYLMGELGLGNGSNVILVENLIQKLADCDLERLVKSDKIKLVLKKADMAQGKEIVKILIKNSYNGVFQTFFSELLYDILPVGIIKTLGEKMIKRALEIIAADGDLQIAYNKARSQLTQGGYSREKLEQMGIEMFNKEFTCKGCKDKNLEDPAEGCSATKTPHSSKIPPKGKDDDNGGNLKGNTSEDEAESQSLLAKKAGEPGKKKRRKRLRTKPQNQVYKKAKTTETKHETIEVTSGEDGNPSEMDNKEQSNASDLDEDSGIPEVLLNDGQSYADNLNMEELIEAVNEDSDESNSNDDGHFKKPGLVCKRKSKQDDSKRKKMKTTMEPSPVNDTQSFTQNYNEAEQGTSKDSSPKKASNDTESEEDDVDPRYLSGQIAGASSIFNWLPYCIIIF